MPKKEDDLEKPIFKDSRGEIRRHNVQGAKFNVLISKKGTLRSGDFHPNTQYDLILKGTMKITLRKNNQDVVIIKRKNELIVIPPNIPHLFESLTKTIMIEWWDGPFQAKYYQPYRKAVEEQLNNLK